MKWNAAAITLDTCRKQLDLTCIHLTCASVLRIRGVEETPLCPVLEQWFAAVLGGWKVVVEVAEALEMKIEMRRKKMSAKISDFLSSEVVPSESFDLNIF